MPRPVLVVDDEKEAREGIAQWLTEAGHPTVAVSSAAEAFDFFVQQGEPCLLLLDLMMPGMTGAELLEELRQDPEFARIPVVIVTAAADIPRGLRADALIKKPLDGHELKRVVASFLTGA